jgi:RNA polymerase sigma factor (sigma-70 family)
MRRFRGRGNVEDRPPDRVDAELVSRARDGDNDAFGVLVEAYEDLAFRTAYLIIGDPDEARDAAQEAFVKAYRALGRFREGAPLRPWLLRIVANTASNRRRSARRRMDLQLRAEAAAAGHSEPSAESTVMRTESQRVLLEAVNALGPDDRLMIGARYFLDLHEAEIAALAGVRPGTVKSRLSRARARLHEALGARRGELRND